MVPTTLGVNKLDLTKLIENHYTFVVFIYTNLFIVHLNVFFFDISF